MIRDSREARELRLALTLLRSMAADGYGWEDVLAALKAKQLASRLPEDGVRAYVLKKRWIACE